MRSSSYIFKDNDAVRKHINRGRSPTVRHAGHGENHRNPNAPMSDREQMSNRHALGRRWSRGRTDHGIKKNQSWQDRRQHLWPGTFARLVGPIRVPQLGSGYLDTKGSFTGDRRTQLTPWVNIMTHTTFTQINLTIMSKRAGESSATSASAKQTPVHCSARKISDKNADMDCHTAHPPEHQAGGDSKREELCQHDSERQDDASSSGQLETRGSPSSKRPSCHGRTLEKKT